MHAPVTHGISRQYYPPYRTRITTPRCPSSGSLTSLSKTREITLCNSSSTKINSISTTFMSSIHSTILRLSTISHTIRLAGQTRHIRPTILPRGTSLIQTYHSHLSMLPSTTPQSRSNCPATHPPHSSFMPAAQRQPTSSSTQSPAGHLIAHNSSSAGTRIKEGTFKLH